MSKQVFLTRRNLLALLSKLDRNRVVPDESQCTIVKQDTAHPKYPTTYVTYITALEDSEYYGTGDRPPGVVWPTDKVDGDYLRGMFERLVTLQEPQPAAYTLLTRSDSGDGYLNLYVQKKWEMFKAVIADIDNATVAHTSTETLLGHPVVVDETSKPTSKISFGTYQDIEKNY